MATITGFTAARMLVIENASIVDGDIVGNDLILKRFDNTTINAGNVRGPTGSPGVTNLELTTAMTAQTTAMALDSPVGSIIDYISTTAPTNWLTMVGQTIVGGNVTYPALWAKLPAGMKSGSDIVMPDTRGRVSAGYHSGNAKFDAIGETGGSETHTLSEAESALKSHTHNGPAHTHSIDHDHPSTQVVVAGAALYAGPAAGDAGTLIGSTITNSPSIAYELSVDIPAYSGSSGSSGSGSTSSANGAATAHNNLQPYITFLKIIKAV